MAFFSINNLSVAFGDNNIFQDFNLNVEKGAIFSILGPSGCGKSTLLKTICGIVSQKSGNVLISDEVINPKIHNIGYIPQQFGLLNWLNIKSNIFISKKIKNIPYNQQDEHIISTLEIENLLSRFPKQLSGGQQQRVALARAWILQPQILLMDEPFAALDNDTKDNSTNLFLQLWKHQKITTIFVTHNINEAIKIGEYIVILSKQPTRIMEIIKNPLFYSKNTLTPRDYFQFQQTIMEKISLNNK
jgi:NitT/TauT family transport system ATP-binding protein